MSTVKNISGSPLDVPILGRMVEDGETVEVPDFQPASTDRAPLPVAWPANRWEAAGGQPGTGPAAVPEPGSPAGDGAEGEVA